MLAEVTKRGALDCQVCVPENWTNEQVKQCADTNNPCGTKNGWQIRKQDDPAQNGAAERVPCSQKPGFVHIMLTC